MYEYIKGTLVDASPHKIIVDVGGVGYSLSISIACFEKLPKMGSEVKIFTALIVREDSHKLFGFLSLDEKELFHTLCEISGIGPRLSLSILGHMTAEDLCLAVEHHNSKAISMIPGIGKKMAERLILELQGKLQKKGKEKTSPPSFSDQSSFSDAIRALINLGYNPMEAQKAVQEVSSKREKEVPLSELISLALKAKKR